ncbi:unnamed protein product [Echinostoma caproni]|uniref:ANF_receptor domain-containing protein n=1 Tax=Echinostoma caproni TaxID=27848 RepID=A0A183B5G6_9TREM|nr:unnamed protein product [Echinostoma caproni]
MEKPNGYARSVCQSAVANQIPDVLIDLTLNQKFICFLGYIARQLDCGIMTVDAPSCMPFPVQQSGFMATDELKQVGIPSVRFPLLAPLVALSSYTNVLHNVFHTGSMFVLGMRDSK